MAVVNLPKKDSSLITASYSLNTAERRLVLLAIIVAKEELHKTGLISLLGDRIEVPTQRYIDLFGSSNQSTYSLLQSTCKSLLSVSLVIQNPIQVHIYGIEQVIG